MYIRKPEYFLMVAKERSIAKAAKKLYVSEPYLSQYITRLEKENEVIFIDRTVSPFVLTEAGEMLCRFIEKTQRLEHEMDDGLEHYRNQTKHVLNIGTSQGRGSVLLPELLEDMMEAFPDIDIVLHERPSDELTMLLRENYCDLILLHYTVMQEDLIYETLKNEKVVLVGPKNHPLMQAYREGEPFDMSKLQNERFILPRPGQSLAKIIYNLFSQYHIKPSHTITTSSSSTTMKLVSKGYGFAFWTESDATRNYYNDQIAIIENRDVPLTFPLVAAYRSGTELKPAARHFIDLCIDYYKKH